jgi:hypothetical protein
MIQRGTKLGQSELGACSAHLANSWAALFRFLLTQQIEDLGFSFRKFIQRSIIAPQSHRIGVWFFTAFTTIKESSSKITLSALYVSAISIAAPKPRASPSTALADPECDRVAAPTMLPSDRLRSKPKNQWPSLLRWASTLIFWMPLGGGLQLMLWPLVTATVDREEEQFVIPCLWYS